MPRRIGRGKPSKPGPGSRELDFRESQRHQSLAQIIPSPIHKKKQEKPIVKTFKGIPEIQAVNLADHYSLSRIINGVINPSKSLEKAVQCLMINLLVNHSDIYQPGKSYSRAERQYIRDQLEVFAKSLSALEVGFGEERRNVGRFENKDKYQPEEFKELLESRLWKGEGSYHIVYAGGPADIMPGKSYAEEIAEEIVVSRYQERMHELESELLTMASGKNKEKIDLRKELDMTSEPDPEMFFRKCVQQLKERPNYQGPGRKYLEIAAEIVGIIDQMKIDVQEEIKKLPGEAEIAAKLSENLCPNGILILEGNIKDVPDRI